MNHSQPNFLHTKLPKLRTDITVIFNDYNLEGKPEWLIHDSARNKFFIIGWLEFEIMERWNLSTPSAIIESINKETTLQVDETDIEKFLYFLSYNYLIIQSSKAIQKRVEEQNLFKNDNRFQWLISHYLFFKIPLVHPDKFLNKTQILGKIIFSKYMAYVMLVLAFIATYQISTLWEQFTHSFSSIFSFDGLVLYFFAFSIIKLFHELGHAYMCKKFGVPVPTLGVAFLVFWPVLYTDTTLSWSLKSNKRMRIAFAGIWVETYVTIIAALIWCNTHNIILQSICYLTITVNWLGSLLINVSPFMRFDGYYILADFLKMPNLQPRAFALTRWQIRKWLFGWQDPPPEIFASRMHYFLVIYAIVTWIYRLILYFGIALLVYHYFTKVIGIILFIIEIYYFILAPIVLEVKTWISSKEKFSLNKETKLTLISAIILFSVIMIPISDTIDLPATLSFDHVFLFSPEGGVLKENMPPIGTKIKANSPIVVISSSDLDQAINQTKLEYNQILIELRRTAIDPKYTHERMIRISDKEKKYAEYQKLHEAKLKLTLTVPFDGILIESDPELRKNTVVMKNEWLGDIINPNVFKIEAYVLQMNVHRIEPNQEGFFYPKNPGLKRIPVKVRSIESVNASQLNCNYATQLKQNTLQETVIETPCYHSSELGGEIPTFYSDEGKYVPVDSVYRVILTTNKKLPLSNVERGVVVLNTTKRQSLIYSFFYKLKSSWIEQSGF